MFETIQPAVSDTNAVDGAIAALADENRPVLIDFDHTLFSSNSTELFLASARPAWLASCLLGLVRGAIPWYLYSSRFHRPRDYLTVLAVIILMPWTLLLWRKRGPALFLQHTTHKLADALRQIPAEKIVIISFGIEALIRPLLRGSPWETCKLVCMRIPCHPRQLFAGKMRLMNEHLPTVSLPSAIFITDSEHDRDLLDAVGKPFLIPMYGKRVLADAQLYLPWRYASLGKYSRSWVVDHTLRVDLFLALVGTRALWYSSALLIIGTVLLFVSLHAVYEIGYFENDFEASLTEEKPTLAAGAELFRGFPLARFAWCWALVLGVVGCGAIARTFGIGQLRTAATWLAVLFITRAVFYVYNRQPAHRRLLFYPFLQASKTLGLLAVVPGFTLGTTLLVSEILAMWMNYVVYRQGGDKASLPREEIRMAAFLILMTGAVLTKADVVADAGPVVLVVMLGWLAWRVRYFGLLLRRGNFPAHGGLKARGRQPSGP